MSVKLGELSMKSHNGKLVIAKLNKRGQVNDYLDISGPIIKRVIQILTTKRDEPYIHQEIKDPETGEIKHYKITCNEMTPEEVAVMKHYEKVRAASAQKGMVNLMGLMLRSFGMNSLKF